MEDSSRFIHEWHGHTTVHPLGLALVLAMGLATLFVPRRYATWPTIVIACFISPAQRVVVAGLDFNFLRLMVLFCWLRILMRGELRVPRWRGLDAAIVLWTVTRLTTALVRVGPSSLQRELGIAFDAMGMYLMFRFLVREWAEVKAVVRGFTLVLLAVAAAFALEWGTGRNLFSVFGGVPEIAMVRDGRLRCQGAFAHPILAGLFWASLLPLVAVQWWEGRSTRWLAVVGTAATMFVIVACGSATPITAVVFAVIGAAAYFVRHWMRVVRWGVLLTLIVLHASMQAPVWHLISRIDIVGGNSGYHRYQLIDGAIRHAGEWWLIGSTRGTAHWGHHTFDVTNYYVVQGLLGGVWLLAVFLAVICAAFAAVGRTWRAYPSDPVTRVWSWSLGVSLFVHATSFVAITYFGQIDMLWYLHLAMIGSMAGLAAQAAGRSDVRRRAGRRRGVSARGQVGRPVEIARAVANRQF